MTFQAWDRCISATQKVGLPAVISLLFMWGANNFANRFLDKQETLVNALGEQGKSLVEMTILQQQMVRQLDLIKTNTHAMDSVRVADDAAIIRENSCLISTALASPKTHLTPVDSHPESGRIVNIIDIESQLD